MKSLKQIIREEIDRSFDWVRDIINLPLTDLQMLQYYIDSETNLMLYDVDGLEFSIKPKNDGDRPFGCLGSGSYYYVTFDENGVLLNKTSEYNNNALKRSLDGVNGFQPTPECREYVSNVYREIYDTLQTVFSDKLR